MTGIQVLASRALLGGIAGGASIGLLTLPRTRSLSIASFDRALTLALGLSRLLLFALVFLLLHIPARGDVAVYYLPEARSVLHGLMPYRDFESSYGPLHPYLDASVLHLWNSPLALILFAIAIEVLTLRLSLALGRRLFADARVRRAGLLYLASPISLQFVAIDGHDNVLLALLMGIALWAILRSRDVLSGFAAGFGVSLLKVIAIFYAPVYLLAGFFASDLPRSLRSGRPWRWAAGFLLSLLAGEGLWLARRLPLLTPIRIESAYKQAGDLPFLVEGLLGIDIPGRLLDAVLLLALAAVWFLVWAAARHRLHLPGSNRLKSNGLGDDTSARVRVMLLALPAVTLTLELFAKKSWPPYLMIVLFPLCLLVAEGGLRRIIAFELFSVVAVTEHSFWATVLGSLGSAVMHAGLLHNDRGWWVYLALLLALLAGYAWLLRLSLKALRLEAGAIALSNDQSC